MTSPSNGDPGPADGSDSGGLLLRDDNLTDAAYGWEIVE